MEKLGPRAGGELTEAIVLAGLIEYGHSVASPFGDNKRYDMVADDCEQLRRVQVKTARDSESEGAIELNTVNDQDKASHGVSRYGVYRARHLSGFHEHGEYHVPLPAAEFAATTSRVTTAPIMSPGYVRLRSDVARVTDTVTEDGRLMLVANCPRPPQRPGNAPAGGTVIRTASATTRRVSGSPSLRTILPS
ncbi:group I intron-associated PD-(D/E)XK endonuclease [Streptomyces sp. NPDC055036]